MSASPRKPLWPESSQLLPQHLQFRDRYVEDLLAHRLSAVAPFAWGVSDLLFDTAALAGGVLKVIRLSARFPSGAMVFVSEGDAPLVKSLPPPEVGTAAVEVSLGIASLSDEAPNVTDDVKASAAVRHRRIKLRGADGTILVPRVQLLCDGEGQERYERMPLARVVSWLGRPELDGHMLPPLLRALPRTFLPDATRAVVDALKSRQAELLSARSARPLDLLNFHPAHAPQLLLLSTVNQALAVLQDTTLRDELAPRTLYTTLAELLGALEGLAGRTDTRPIPAYRHEAPGPGFRTIIDRLLALVPEVARDPHLVFRLDRVNPSTFSLKVADPSIFRRRVYLVASGSGFESSLEAHLAAHAKIASGSMLPSIVQSAIRGVAIAAEFDPPPSLPSSSRHACFRLDIRSQYWADVLEQRVLMMHVPSAPADLEMSLYVLTA